MARLHVLVLALLATTATATAASRSRVDTSSSTPPPLHVSASAVPIPPRRLGTPPLPPPPPATPSTSRAADLSGARAEYEAETARLDAVISSTYAVMVSVFAAGAVLGWHVAVLAHGLRPAGTWVCRFYDWSSVVAAGKNKNNDDDDARPSGSAGGGDSRGVKPAGLGRDVRGRVQWLRPRTSARAESAVMDRTG